MTDNEIIKALECCNRPANQTSCDDCPYQFSDEKCSSKLIDDALDLINRQKVEIADLQDGIKCEKETNKHLSAEYIDLQKQYDSQIECLHNIHAITLRRTTEYARANAKSEAIKEFAKRLKGLLSLNIRVTNEDYLDIAVEIDNLVKEMVGEGK